MNGTYARGRGLTSMRLAMLALCLSGCASPTCAPTALAELRTHAGYALEDLVARDVIDARDELGIATGLAPHPPLLRGTLVADSPGYAAVDSAPRGSSAHRAHALRVGAVALGDSTGAPVLAAPCGAF